MRVFSVSCFLFVCLMDTIVLEKAIVIVLIFQR